jgi:hypothetical protein
LRRAQQPAVPVVGFVNAGSSDPPLAAAFRKGLNDAGYVESQNVTVEYHWLEARRRYRHAGRQRCCTGSQSCDHDGPDCLRRR